MIKVTPELSVKGELFSEYREVKNLPFLFKTLRHEIQMNLKSTLETATALNMIIKITEDGVDIIDATEVAVGVFTSFDPATRGYVMRSAGVFDSADIASIYAAAANIVEVTFQNIYRRVLSGAVIGDDPVLDEFTVVQPTTLTGVLVTGANVSTLGEFDIKLVDTHQTEQPVDITGVVLSAPSALEGDYDLVFSAPTSGTLVNVTGVTIDSVQGADDTGNLVSTAFTAAALTNVTGVTITDVVGANTTAALASTGYTASVLANVTGVTVTRVLGIDAVGDLVSTAFTASYPLSGGVANITGVTVTNVVGRAVTANLIFLFGDKTLAFGDGAAVNVAVSGNYTVTDSAGTTTLSVTVVSENLPGMNKGEVGMEVTPAMLSFGGGTAVNVSTNGSYVLTDLAGTTDVRVTVVAASLAATDVTDADVEVTVPQLSFKAGSNIKVGTGGSYTLNAPASTTSLTVTVIAAALALTNQSDSIAVTAASLAYAGGTAVNVSADGEYVLENADASTALMVTVVAAELAATNETDTVVVSGAKLTYGRGSSVDIIESADYTLTATDSETIVATVTYAGLPTADATDTVAALGEANTLQLGRGTLVALTEDGDYTLTDVKDSITVTVVMDDLPNSDVDDTFTLTASHDIDNNYLLSFGNEA